MTAPKIIAKSDWHCIDFVADIHLQTVDATWQAFYNYIHNTPAQAVFLLGDVVDSWVGDDILEHPDHTFEQQLAHVLQHISQTKNLFFMHGNRDFLIGKVFCQAAGLSMLADPTILQLDTPISNTQTTFTDHIANSRVLLSHGDALCIDDKAYMQLRQQVRNPQWQKHILQMPLVQRLALAQQMRQQSMQHQNSLGVEGHADVDTPMAYQWLHDNHSAILVHGHTHKPNDHALQIDNKKPLLMRRVLSDWDFNVNNPRADVLRLQKTDCNWSLERILLQNTVY